MYLFSFFKKEIYGIQNNVLLIKQSYIWPANRVIWNLLNISYH